MNCYHQFSSDQDSSSPLEQVVRDENGRTRRKAVFGDEGDWDQDDDTLDMSADDEDKNGVGSDEGDEASDNDDDDAVEMFENNEDANEGEVLRGKTMESFESDSDDDDDSGESDNGDEEEEEEVEVDEEIVFNLKPRKQSRKEKLPDKQTTPLKRTKRRVVHDESEGDSEQGESDDDDEVEFEEKENDDVNKNSGDDSDSASEVQSSTKGKRKIRHDVIVERGDEQRVKKKFKKETNSLGHTRKSVEDSLSSQTKASKSKKVRAGSERIEEAFVKSSKTKRKAAKEIFDEKELSEAGGDSDENEVDMDSPDDEDDAGSGEEDDTALEDSSLGLEEEGIIALGLAQSER